MGEYYCPAMVGPVTAKSPTAAAKELVAYLAPRGASYVSMETSRSYYEIHFIEERGWVLFRIGDDDEGIDQDEGGKVIYAPGEFDPGEIPRHMQSYSRKPAPNIPVGPDGFVPMDALRGRNDRRSQRARDMDSRKMSKTVLEPPLTPRQAAAWWKDPGRSDILGIDTPSKRRKTTPVRYSDDIAQRFADTIARIRFDLQLDRYTLEVVDGAPCIVFTPKDAELEYAFDRYGIRFDKPSGVYMIRLDSPYAVESPDGSVGKPPRNARTPRLDSQYVPRAERAGKGFFDGLSPRRSSYADLDWVGDPFTASMIAGETLSDEMVKAYRDAAFYGWEADEWASANRKRGKRRRL